jgi:Flp pilus assembly protein CpaB
MAAATTRVEVGRDGGPTTELQPGPSRTLRGRISRGHVVMVIAGVVGVVLSFAALREHDGNARVLVAAHEIRAGETVDPADFRSEAVTMGSALLATAVRAHDAPTVRGKVAASTIAAGELVVRRTLRPRAARHGLRAMSIPIDPARAVSGRLAAGDRVDVLFAGTREVSIIVADAEVLAVDARGRGGIGESASPFTVTVAVSAQQSQLLAAAIADGDVSITRTTGARPAAGTASQLLDRSGSSGALDPTAR